MKRIDHSDAIKRGKTYCSSNRTLPPIVFAMEYSPLREISTSLPASTPPWQRNCSVCATRGPTFMGVVLASVSCVRAGPEQLFTLSLSLPWVATSMFWRVCSTRLPKRREKRRVQQLTMSSGLARSFECINKGGRLRSLGSYDSAFIYDSAGCGIVHTRSPCSPGPPQLVSK